MDVLGSVVETVGFPELPASHAGRALRRAQNGKKRTEVSQDDGTVSTDGIVSVFHKRILKLTSQLLTLK